jgi:heme o synthase
MSNQASPTKISLSLSQWRDFLTLIKPEVTFLVIIATSASFLLSTAPFSLRRFLAAIFGTALISGGTATLNHYFERKYDRLMHRTMNRPLPSGRLHPGQALGFGLSLSAAGTGILYFLTNPLTSMVGVLALLSYLGIYTPLKRHSSLCTFIGAFPGAAPALMGWTAATGSLNAGGWFFFLLLLVWQIPHFLSIAWIYREDYQRAGMLMLPPSDLRGDSTFRTIWLSTLLLAVISLVPGFLGKSGWGYSFPTLILGISFLAVALHSAHSRSRQNARLLLHASVFYLPLLYGFMLIEKWASAPSSFIQ